MARMLAVLTAFIASSAAAQDKMDIKKHCGLYENMAGILLNTYDEHLVGSVTAATGIRHEMFGSAAGSWTILMVLPDGVTCVLGDGTARGLGPMPGVGKPM